MSGKPANVIWIHWDPRKCRPQIERVLRNYPVQTIGLDPMGKRVSVRGRIFLEDGFSVVLFWDKARFFESSHDPWDQATILGIKPRSSMAEN